MDGDARAVAPEGKAAFRRRLNQARAAFCREGELSEHYDRLFTHLASLISDFDPIAGYVAHRNEPQLLPFLTQLHRRGRRIALPFIDEDGAMHFMPWTPQATLSPGHAGILQPPATIPVNPGTLLVPLVGFTRRGTRLGQGGGFYDRWFGAHPCAHRIGVAWSCQEAESLPTEPWDAALDAVGTEEEAIGIRAWGPLAARPIALSNPAE